MAFGGKLWTVLTLFLAKTKKITCFQTHGLKHRGNSKIQTSVLSAPLLNSHCPVPISLLFTSHFLQKKSLTFYFLKKQAKAPWRFKNLTLGALCSSSQISMPSAQCSFFLLTSHFLLKKPPTSHFFQKMD